MTLNEGQEKNFNAELRKLKVESIMEVDFCSIGEEEPLSRAQEIFVVRNVFTLAVVDKAGKLKGIFSHKYLYKAQSPRKMISPDIVKEPGILLEGEYYYDRAALNRYQLKDLMFDRPPTLRPEASVFDAIKVMADRHVGVIPIVDGNHKVLGLLSNDNVIDAMAAVFNI